MYVAALLYFEKITTGNAKDTSWNIDESIIVQNTLARIIDDYKGLAFSLSVNSSVPHYILVLFSHYCSKQSMPRFHDIDQFQAEMSAELQKHLFLEIISPEHVYLKDGKTRITQTKVKELFPNARQFINDQGQGILMNKAQYLSDAV